MANPLRVYFWMLGQDARLGLLGQWGFSPLQPGVYKRGPLLLHQLGLALEEGLLYRRECGRFYLVPSSTLPPDLPVSAVAMPWREGWESLWPHLHPYEDWVRSQIPGYRNRLLRICPPLLRPQRRKWKEIFGFGPP